MNRVNLLFTNWRTGEPDNGSGLQIKTNCVNEFAGTNDGLLFTFCNGDQCCSTDEIKLNNRNCCLDDDCATPDVFGSSETGSCKYFDFESYIDTLR